jgi:hypothetical protein
MLEQRLVHKLSQPRHPWTLLASRTACGFPSLVETVVLVVGGLQRAVPKGLCGVRGIDTVHIGCNIPARATRLWRTSSFFMPSAFTGGCAGLGVL